MQLENFFLSHYLAIKHTKGGLSRKQRHIWKIRFYWFILHSKRHFSIFISKHNIKPFPQKNQLKISFFSLQSNWSQYGRSDCRHFCHKKPNQMQKFNITRDNDLIRQTFRHYNAESNREYYCWNPRIYYQIMYNIRIHNILVLWSKIWALEITYNVVR